MVFEYLPPEDEAAARIKMEIDSKPAALDEVDRKIMQLEIEREALKKETDRASKDRLEKLEKELAELEEDFRIVRRQVLGLDRHYAVLGADRIHAQFHSANHGGGKLLHHYRVLVQERLTLGAVGNDDIYF